MDAQAEGAGSTTSVLGAGSRRGSDGHFQTHDARLHKFLAR